MPFEAHDAAGYMRRQFRLEEKWAMKIALMPEKYFGVHWVTIHLTGNRVQNALVTECKYVQHYHLIFSKDEEIVDVTHLA